MKLSLPLLAITSFTAGITFLCSYFYDLTMTNFNQYLAIVGVMFLDGVFGMIAGVKREGFQTCKAIKVLRNTVAWMVILTVILMVEQGFVGTAWLSEVIIVPFMVFQIISALKNASIAGFIQMSLLNQILDKIDKHKGTRNEEPKE